MIEIEKTINGRGYDFFTINTDDGIFSISFQGNLDLYFNYECKNLLKETSEKTFILTKENYYLYSLFSKLYEDIKNCNVYDENELKDDNIWGFGLTNAQLNKEIRNQEERNPYRLFQNNKVEFHSDDFDYEESSILYIEKIDDKIKLTFQKGKNDLHMPTFAVRICNSGSRYNHFNILFMKLYNKLGEYDPNYHQVHIEEYLYELKRTRKSNKKDIS